MATIHLHQTTTAAPEQLLAGLTDIGPGGSKIFPNSADGPWRAAIGKVEALSPRHIVTDHKNRELDDDAKRTIEQTQQYLDDADDLLRTEGTAVGYFNAKIERYPDYLGRLILWVTARALYGVREHPAKDPRQIILNAWL